MTKRFWTSRGRKNKKIKLKAFWFCFWNSRQNSTRQRCSNIYSHTHMSCRWKSNEHNKNFLYWRTSLEFYSRLDLMTRIWKVHRHFLKKSRVGNDINLTVTHKLNQITAEINLQEQWNGKFPRGILLLFFAKKNSKELKNDLRKVFFFGSLKRFQSIEFEENLIGYRKFWST